MSLAILALINTATSATAKMALANAKQETAKKMLNLPDPNELCSPKAERALNWQNKKAWKCNKY
ncbi:TPA: hypothetical protein QDB06_000854 [Burkholderia vietnamiensis]|nr:hypothetical protein [Burkholderia vietnamiensis]